MTWTAHDASEDPTLDNVYNLKIKIGAKDSDGRYFHREILVDSASYDMATEEALALFKDHFGVDGHVAQITEGYYLTT